MRGSSFSLRATVVPAIATMILAANVGSPCAVVAQDPGTANVHRVFATWQEWEAAYDDLALAIEALARLGQEPIESAEELALVMEARDRVYRVARGVEGYLYVRLQLDGGDEEARSREHLVDETDRQWYSKALPRFTRVITDLGLERTEEWMAGDETLRRYEHFFRGFFAGAEHPLSAGEGEFRALSSVFGQQSSRIYKALAISEAPVVEVTLESGESLELNPGNARSVLEELPGAVDRERANRAWLEALGAQSQTYAALLEGIVRRQEMTAETRGFDSALSAALHSDAIPAAAVRNVVRVAREGSAPLRRYHSLRQAVLGLEDYGLAHRFVPFDPGGRKIDYSEARVLITESSATLGPEVHELVGRAFEEGWIDSVERPGKRAHGGATFVDGHPFVLVNYRASLENVFQLAHEIGHAVHAVLAHETQPFVYSHPSSLTGEAMASVFEGALVDHMVGRATSRDEKIRVLDLSIQNILRLFYRPMLDADFEHRIYDGDEAITGPSLGALYLAVVTDYYGESVNLTAWDAHAWQKTPHYYTSPLYMGRYGLSSAAANALLPGLTSPDEADRATARRALVELMRAGSSGSPLHLLATAGADLLDPQTIEALVVRMGSLVGKLEQVVDQQ